jgi:hypothetical protein
MNTATKNAIGNLGAIRRATPVKRLAGLYQGRLAVVFGAGPSLTEETLETTRRYRDLIIVLAVDRAARKVHEAGITPEYVASVEYADGPEKFFYEPPGSTLLFHQAATPKYVSLWTGPLVTYNARGSNLGLGSLDNGGHAGHAAVALAHLMGCVPVVLVGVDLAYLPGATHAEGIETYPFDRNGETVKIESVTGGEVETGVDLELGIRNLARFAAATRWRIIQTSHFGARIPGTIELPLERALSIFAGGA